MPITVAGVPPARVEPNGNAAQPVSGIFLATIATFRDELFSFLMFQHYRGTGSFHGSDLLLCYQDRAGEPQYRIYLVLPGDTIAAVARAAELSVSGKLESFDYRFVPSGSVRHYRNQTRLFLSAYNLPVKRRLEDLSRRELHSLLRRFIRFKSTTDPRIRKRMEPLPKALAPGEAQRLAGDIIEVAHFYRLPLEVFLGIGAMENNYMNVRGDLGNTAWKRRPAKDDIVLERRKGRVRVLNDSAGVWQITRETLRYIHKLYLEDSRDYCLLPEHLRPPRELAIDEIDPPVLTTYAGLLLRDLLDRFKGDVSLAVGAYNGGPDRPNMRYEEGVRSAALHARTVLERAAALNGRSVMQIPWISPL